VWVLRPRSRNQPATGGAEGFVVDPGATAVVGAVVTIPDAEQRAGAHQVIVRYASKGRRYAELTNITYELEPDGCE
jgi:hypothetical protein